MCIYFQAAAVTEPRRSPLSSELFLLLTQSQLSTCLDHKVRIHPAVVCTSVPQPHRPDLHPQRSTVPCRPALTVPLVSFGPTDVSLLKPYFALNTRKKMYTVSDFDYCSLWESELAARDLIARLKGRKRSNVKDKYQVSGSRSRFRFN